MSITFCLIWSYKIMWDMFWVRLETSWLDLIYVHLRLEFSGLLTDLFQQWKVTVRPRGSSNQSVPCNELQALMCSSGLVWTFRLMADICGLPHSASQASTILIGRATGSAIRTTQLLVKSSTSPLPRAGFNVFSCTSALFMIRISNHIIIFGVAWVEDKRTECTICD